MGSFYVLAGGESVPVVRANHCGIGRGVLAIAALLLVLGTQHELGASPAETVRLAYELRYAGGGEGSVSVRITPAGPLAAPLALVIPRTYPGGYSIVRYDDFVEDVRAFAQDGASIACKKDEDGPRWAIGKGPERVARIEYRVNVGRMEDRIRDSSESSKMRKDYVGILGYSVFGYIDGFEQLPVALRVEGPTEWPVLSTLDPRGPAAKGGGEGTAEARASNYDTLADSQVAMGPGLQFRELAGKINLLVAVYSEGEEDVDAESRLAREALDRVQEYFGDTPFPTYTVLLELLKPREGHDYDFSQEHDTSGTFSLTVENATNAHSSERQRYVTLSNYAHHMAHSWVPKRVWGAGYRPFNWEMTPVIETIWFNEGFGRYAGMQALFLGMVEEERKARRQQAIDRMRGVMEAAPPFIKRMPLTRLSQEGSFLYGADFRTGMNLFARGYLMAAEMDGRIQEKTQGRKSLRDGFRALLAWSDKNRRALKVEEMTKIISEAGSVDVHDIVARWMEAPGR